MHISNNHPSACQPCIIWIIWPAKYCNSSFFVAALCPCRLQFRWDTSETSKYLLSRPISPHLLSPSATLTLTLLSGTRIPRQQSIFFRDWSHLPGRRRGSSIGLIGRIIWRSQGQTSGNTPISESRHQSSSQKCPADPCHFGRVGGQAPRGYWRCINSCSLHRESSRAISHGSETTCWSPSAGGEYQTKG